MRHPFLLSSLLIASACNSAQATDCSELAKVKFGHVTIDGATVHRAAEPISSAKGESLGNAAADFCRIRGTSRPARDSDIRFELWVPAGRAWNGKFAQLGNGGFAGSLPYGSMLRGLSQGYAVAGTDDGHQSAEMTDASWALDHPEKIKDFGWRAIRETTLAGKRLLGMLESKAPSESYFYGCSDGGREALMMAERFPSYFDGIVAGAPAYAMTRLLTSGAKLLPSLRDPAGHLGAPQLALLQRQALQACGQGASYLQDPRSCRLELETLKCSGDAADTCLTEPQIRTAHAIYGAQKNPADGSTLYAPLPGAEGLKGSWADWITGGEDHQPSAVEQFVHNYLEYMLKRDPKSAVTDADLAHGERTFGPIIDSDSADLSAFKAHGGKLIQFHGWNDPAIPAGYSLEYRQRLKARMGTLDDFYRLYMVPGMLHCAGGDAPTAVNWLATLDAWVERGSAPHDLIASGSGTTQTLRPVEE